MSLALRFHRHVSDDLAAIAEYFGAAGGQAVADRLINSALAACRDVAAMQGMGSPKSFRTRAGLEVRSWGVPGFPNHLILYQVTAEQIIVLAILHGARDIDTILRER